MAKFPIYDTKEKEMLRAEWLAHEENRSRDVLTAIRNRTMTKKLYLEFTHSLRLFIRPVKKRLAGVG